MLSDFAAPSWPYPKLHCGRQAVSFAAVFQCTVKALYDYRAQREDELCFPKQALILNVDKQEGGWWVNPTQYYNLTSCVSVNHIAGQLVLNLCCVFRWRGDYGGKKQLWFPANYVEEVPSSPTRELDEAVSSDSNVRRSVYSSNHNQFFSLILFVLSQSTENSPLGTFLKGFIDVPTCHVGESHKTNRGLFSQTSREGLIRFC